jgi:hypothetical protein
MKRRMGEKDGQDDSRSDSGSSDEDPSIEYPPNTAVDNDENQAGSRAQIQAESSTPRSSSQSVTRTGGCRANSSNPRRAKRARPGDNIEQAMMESCKEMAQCYKQLVSTVVKQSERDSSRTLETSEELRLQAQEQNEQSVKLDQQSLNRKLDEQGERSDEKLDRQGQRLDQVLSLLQGLYESNSTTSISYYNQKNNTIFFITHFSALARLRS